MTRMSTTIGIIGHTGTVGAAVYAYFRKRNVSVLGFSRHAKEKGVPTTLEKINKICHMVFICLPTPLSQKTQLLDISAIEETLQKLSSPKIVVLKSTLLPGSTEALQKKYANLRILYNPEFLARVTAHSDFIHPDRQLVGYTDKSKSVARMVLRLLPTAVYSKTLPCVEAEIIKLAHNTFGAMSIIYANYLYDISQKMNANYDHVKKGFTASKYVQKGILRYMTIYHNAKRGFGGPCFPKDINSFLVFCKSIGVNVETIQAARNANKRLLRSQGLTEQSAEVY